MKPCNHFRVKGMNRAITIGSLARDTECPPETIRYYEREGLLPPATRTAGNYRVYGATHLERLDRKSVV